MKPNLYDTLANEVMSEDREHLYRRKNRGGEGRKSRDRRETRDRQRLRKMEGEKETEKRVESSEALRGQT